MSWAWLEITHHTRYDYAAPVSPALHLAHLMPLADAAQQVVSSDLTIEPVPDERRDETDVFGNRRSSFAVIVPHRRLTVRATSVVGVAPRFEALQAGGGDDYELCFTAPADARALVEAVSSKLCLRITRIGRIVADEGVQPVRADGEPWTPPRRGYDHFVTS